MLVICAANTLVVFKAPKTSSRAKSVSQGIKPEAKPGHKKLSTSSKQPFVSNKEATKFGSSKAPTSSKTGHSKKRKESSSAMDSNLSQPLVSTPVDTGMHKEDRQATGGTTSLGVTSEQEPTLNSIVGMNKGTKNTSYDHLSAGTDPHVLIDKTKSVSEGLETILTQLTTQKRPSSIARQVEEEEASSTIKLEDLAKLISHVQPSFKDLDSLEDDHVIVVDDSDEDEETEKDKVHPTPNAETKDTSVPKSSSPRSYQIQELTNQVLILQSQKHKLELEKNKAEAEATLLKTQPSFPNVEQLKELLVKSLKTKFSNILSAQDFSSSLPTKQKYLPSKLNELTGEVKDFASSKAGDQSVPLAGQADTMHAEEEKNTNQATISQLF
ncbi:hypothetical protein Tco_1411176 [Tanacetum coccineum]